jgi:hypothetical protein
MPTWERGYRCHGYWIGTKRFGSVSIGPRNLTQVKRDGYTWTFIAPDAKISEGSCPTLKQGKRIVENLYKKHYAS